ncbi:MAG: beta-ketoacyl synthase N-terminal-like domain-containing protein, partial [Terriglobia bacterium]
MSRRRVVITGLGIVCPVGGNVAESWAAILRGESGIAPITRFDVAAFPTRFGGAVRNFSVETYMSLKDARRMDEFMHYGIAAGVQAVEDAALEFDKLDRDRCGVVTGAGIGGLKTIEETHAAY